MNSLCKTAFYYRLFGYDYTTIGHGDNADDAAAAVVDGDNGNRSFISLLKCASLPLRVTSESEETAGMEGERRA